MDPHKQNWRSNARHRIWNNKICWYQISWTNIIQWRHNGRDSVSNHQPHDCFPNRLFRYISKKTSKLRVTGLCAGNSPHKWPVTRKRYPFDDVIMIEGHINTVSLVSVISGHMKWSQLIRDSVNSHVTWVSRRRTEVDLLHTYSSHVNYFRSLLSWMGIVW